MLVDIDIIMRFLIKKMPYQMFINRGRKTTTKGAHASLVGILLFFVSLSLGEEL